MFEIKYKDNRGRVGLLKTKHGTVKTPALMPVIHPKKQKIDVKKFDTEIVITNAYLVYKDEELKEKALSEGIHKLINFDGPVMTDSGSFQLSVYGDVDISNKEVIEFQEAIKTDIGTSLDIPTAPYETIEKTKEDLKITLERAKEAVEYKEAKNMEMLLNSVVQGSTYPELRSYCADELSKLNADLYPIGAVVPLMENYKYRDLVDVVMSSVSHLPDSTPRHLMGAGHPMLFALAVAMGCDLFDSAAYILYAEDDRFLTTRGTYKLENLQEMPCSCKICNNYTPDDLRAMEKDERTKLIAEHNLNVSFAELRVVRQAIIDGDLMELVEERCRVHPMLLDACRQLDKYTDDLELYDPRIKKSAFFYTGPESLRRPEVTRHLNKLKNMDKKRDLVILPKSRKPYSKYINKSDFGDFYTYGSETDLDLDNTDFMVLDVPFCLIPLDIDEVYPLSQNESPKINDIDSIEFIENFISEFIEYYDQTLISSKIIDLLGIGLYNIHPDSDNVKFIKDDERKVKAIADYQFGNGVGEFIFEGNLKIEKSKNTGKIRHIYSDGTLIANMRASDSFFVLAKEGAKRLHRFKAFPENRVVVNKDSEPFAREGKSVFSKFVLDCDTNIRSKDEVLIVNEDDELLAFGKALLNHNEIMDFNTGQAIKTRKGFGNIVS
ncbi:tRNA guanosine(15) transglycosylase TgtA [Methanobrevibacter arboriphilus]|uniref:tRNA guanosine(15) transglycosylase TgtA n=1 Tax=Methanobrevibacter arboriphilus TaxID=39441 RepID=UPI0009B552BA|nr:tRNA guanosine(15) transglycosylase TgtA [Methanobrevibacter arboriphilus]